MWPWEHLAFGYLWYALGRRAIDSPPPSNAAAVALSFGTQFPDLVDKPLAWGFGILPSGVSLAHSILFAIPLGIVVVLVAAWRGHRSVGVGFVVGHLSHIAGDGLYPLVVTGSVSPGYMLWPLVPTTDDQGPFFGTVSELWAAFVGFLATPRGQLYLSMEVVFLLGVLVLWLWEGSPGVPLRLRPSRD